MGWPSFLAIWVFPGDELTNERIKALLSPLKKLSAALRFLGRTKWGFPEPIPQRGFFGLTIFAFLTEISGCPKWRPREPREVSGQILILNDFYGYSRPLRPQNLLYLCDLQIFLYILYDFHRFWAILNFRLLGPIWPWCTPLTLFSLFTIICAFPCSITWYLQSDARGPGTGSNLRLSWEAYKGLTKYRNS